MNKEEYKKTDLGYLPLDWNTKRIEDICEILDSKRIPLNKEQRDNMKGDIPYYGANGVVDYINDYLFDEDLILMAEDGGYFDEYRTRHIAYKVKGKSWVNNHAHVLKVLDSQTYEFIYYTLVHKNILPFINGGTRAKLNQADLKKILIQYPPLKEQQKIAEILSSVDAAIEKTEQVIAKTEEIKKGLMQQLLTKGIGHTEYKNSELGEIPLKWEIKQLKDLLEIKYGKDQKQVICEDGKYNILGTGGIIGKTNSYLYDKPSVLIGRKGTINRPMYIEEPFWTVDTLFYTVINPNNFEKWIYYAISNINLMKYNEATGVPSLSVNNLNTIKFAVPPYDEQVKIVNILDSTEQKIQSENLKLNRLMILKQGLMQQLLTGKVRVTID